MDTNTPPGPPAEIPEEIRDLFAELGRREQNFRDFRSLRESLFSADHSPGATKMVLPPADGDVGELVAWLTEQAVRAADCKRPMAAGMLTWAAEVAGEHADLLEQRQAAPVPAPDDRGVLPMIVSETGADDEPELERIICASISGGTDYVNNMPRELSLERIMPEGSTFARYIQADAEAAPAPAADHSDVRPAPVAWLYRGEPDYGGQTVGWRCGWVATTSQQLAEFKSLPGKPIPLFSAHALPLPSGEVEG